MSARQGTWEADPAHFRRANRREFVFAGLFGGLGLQLGDLLRLEAHAATPANPQPIEAKAKAVIHIFLQGGFAHQDSFDPKPDAPIEYRGELKPIPTKLPGVFFSEHLADTAKVAEDLTVVRSVSHTEVDHGRGEHNMFTGYKPSPALVYPSMGSVTSMELGPRGELPPYVCVPTQTSPFAGTGFLSSAYGPFALGSDPARGNFKVRDLNLPEGVDAERLQRRRKWLSVVDEHFANLEKADVLDAMDAFHQRAYGMIASPKARAAFDLSKEPTALRKEYGRYAGPRFMLARRLVEAGVRFVSVTFGQWDTHAFHFRGIERQMPAFDQGFAALIRDLKRRGMLESTLVMVSTEFGRTPKVNMAAGRDHWPKVFSIVLAGGGIKAGQVYGASDAVASEPAKDRLRVEDLSATLYNLLGIDHTKDLMAPGNRPIPLVYDGQVVKGLLS